MNEELSKLKEEVELYFKTIPNCYSYGVKIIDYDENSVTASVMIIPPKSPDRIDIKW